ncbi:MAG: MerR family transcriptional regulator, light-induced transcriptional regulator, partial [Pseudonocardiales bacterium]|nr:MerR family transcriptional regulator, light-induced transcriptional regulator [Pseudonocardiales bacterium]
MPDNESHLPADADQVDALTTAALELDQTTATTIMNRTLRGHGVVGAWTDLLAPALRRRGERFDRTADGVAAEHLLSECTRTALSAVIWRRRRWNRCPPVLLAAPDGEQHVLPLLALAAALAEVHQPSVLLGASLPPRALLDAATQLEPTVIFLWAHTPDTARRAELTMLRHHPDLDQTTLVLGGPGWP